MNTTGTGTRPPTTDTHTNGENTLDDTNDDTFDSDLGDDLDSDLSGAQRSRPTRPIGRDAGGGIAGMRCEPHAAPAGGTGAHSEAGGGYGGPRTGGGTRGEPHAAGSGYGDAGTGGGVRGELLGGPVGGYGEGSEAGGDGRGASERAAGVRTWELSPGADAASRARALTRHALREWHVTGPADADDIVLIVDELVTNAVVHGDGPVRLTLRLDGPTDGPLDGPPVRRRLSGDVHDDGVRTPAEAPAPPTGAQPPDWSEAGRGLLLVAALATAHGTRPDPADQTGKTGKTVWFTRLLAPAPHNPA
ncbi:ATP-binding protein [Actinomadura decatromicini]|uniref:ATP-binding protein n=1 Tax=Actinomadura decatromicini TaxID=2604572 RepID=A0A5D3FB63_9ACTN|nr:ATP-binding protein [Actinomadura decatromicini]TYK44960.1 ATP-binding protein [Actinomadura decatromicini]